MNLDKMKFEMHLAKVTAARIELEYKKEQRLQEIINIEENINNQINEEKRLKQEIDKRS